MIVIATIDELLDKVDSKYTLVHLSARRAREINAYYHSLGEGIGRYTPPLVESSSNKPLSIALEEIAAEKIVPHYPGDAQEVAEGLLGTDSESGDVVDIVQALTGAPDNDDEEGMAVDVSELGVDPEAIEGAPEEQPDSGDADDES